MKSLSEGMVIRECRCHCEIMKAFFEDLRFHFFFLCVWKQKESTALQNIVFAEGSAKEAETSLLPLTRGKKHVTTFRRFIRIFKAPLGFSGNSVTFPENLEAEW